MIKDTTLWVENYLEQEEKPIGISDSVCMELCYKRFVQTQDRFQPSTRKKSYVTDINVNTQKRSSSIWIYFQFEQ